MVRFPEVRTYLDHNATTPLAPAVLEAMIPVLREQFGNASSVHTFGQTAKAHVDGARAAVADPALREALRGGNAARFLRLY